MKESVFRKSSVENLKTPEQLNTYIKSATPATWAILSAIILFLAAVFAWIYFGCIYTRIKGVAVQRDGKLYCYADAVNVYRAKSSVKVTVKGKEYVVSNPKTDPIKLSPKDDSEHNLVLGVGNYTSDEWICKFELGSDPDDKEDYIDVAVVTIEELSPSTFLTGGSDV